MPPLRAAERSTEEKKTDPQYSLGHPALAVPVFVVVFFSDLPHANLWALAIFVAAELTDILDGYLARRNGWITDVGKILDRWPTS